jgi:hypothetical protein
MCLMRKLSIFVQILVALPLVAAGIALKENALSFPVLGQIFLVLALTGIAVAAFATTPRFKAYVFRRLGWQPMHAIAPGPDEGPDGARRRDADRMETDGGSAESGGASNGTAPGAGSPAGGAGGGGSGGGRSGGGSSPGGGAGGGGGRNGGGGTGHGGSGMPPEDGLPENIHVLVNAYLARGEFPPTELVADLDDLPRYVARNPDQELWLQLVHGLNYDLPASYSCFQAMVRHPACENAVAALLLHQTQAEFFFDLSAERARALDPGAFELIRLICERDAAQGFPADGVGDSRFLDREDLRMRSARIRPHPDTPLKVPIRLLLTTPNGRPPRERYFVDETGVYRLA